MSKPDGGSAFPDPGAGEYWGKMPSKGMTLRQWYAGMAMQGFVAKGITEEAMQKANLLTSSDAANIIAIYALLVADAMIAHEREGA